MDTDADPEARIWVHLRSSEVQITVGHRGFQAGRPCGSSLARREREKTLASGRGLALCDPPFVRAVACPPQAGEPGSALAWGARGRELVRLRRIRTRLRRASLTFDPSVLFPMITVYVLRACVGGKRYVGITDNLARRVNEHRRANSTVSKLLGEFTVMLTEPYATYAEARKREKYLKSGQGREWLDREFPR